MSKTSSKPKLFQDAWNSTRQSWASDDESDRSLGSRTGSGVIVFFRRISSSRIGSRKSMVDVDVDQPNLAPRGEPAATSSDGILKGQTSIGARCWRVAKYIILLIVLGAFIGSAAYFISKMSGQSRHHSSELEDRWIDLIQAASPSTKFDDASSPQRKALDWMAREKDMYTTASAKNALNEDVEQQFVLQRFALLTLFYSIGFSLSGNPAFRPHQPTHACEWTKVGVGCDSHQVVTSFHPQDINKNDGVLPPELGILTGLTSLDVSNNNLVDTIPSEVGQLINLELLDISQNELEGPLPTNELTSLTNLVQLHLYDNQGLTGSIPFHLCLDGTNLTEILIDCNNLECDCCEDGANSQLCDASVAR